MKKYFRPWLRILLVGAVLFVAAEQALRHTGNPNFFPTTVLLGASIVPVAFVAFFYDYVRHREISLPLLTTCAVAGGALGLLAAGVVQYEALGEARTLTLVVVSLSEEAAKLLFPLIMFIGWKYRHEADGLLFGIAAGMGFAALETMGYGLTTFLRSGGDIDVVQRVLLIRGFLSPAGHAAWTGFLCAILWRERERAGHVSINWKVLLAYLVVVALHTFWNMVNTMGAETTAEVTGVVAANAAIAAVSLTLIILRYRSARRSLRLYPSHVDG